MITDALSNYRTFEYTQKMFEFGVEAFDRSSNDWLDVAIKVGEIILSILSIIPAFILDLLMIPSSAIYTEFFEERDFIYNPEPPPEIQFLDDPEVEVNEHEAEQELTAIQNIMQCQSFPVTDHLTEQHARFLNARPPSERENIGFMTKAVENGLKILPGDQRRIYLEMISMDGLVDEGEAPLDVFQWLASCLIIQYLRLCAHRDYSRGLFPRTSLEPLQALHSENDIRIDQEHRDHCHQIRALGRRFSRLSQRDRAIVIHQTICRRPAIEVSAEVRELIQEIDAQAMHLSRDGRFNAQVFWPSINPFKILIEESRILDQ